MTRHKQITMMLIDYWHQSSPLKKSKYDACRQLAAKVIMNLPSKTSEGIKINPETYALDIQNTLMRLERHDIIAKKLMETLLPPDSKADACKIDVGIITIREDEFMAVLREFTEHEKSPNISKPPMIVDSRHYNLCTIPTVFGNLYQIALIRCVEQGCSEAQDAARDLIEDVKPRLIIVVGIAGGIPHSNFTLGDVIISTRVYDFNINEAKEGGLSKIDVRGGPLDRKLAATIANLPARAADLGQWNNALKEYPLVDFENVKNYYGNDEWIKNTKNSLFDHFSKQHRTPVFTAGAIASSDKLVKDTVLMSQWLQSARSILAVEMESAGVYRACFNRVPALAIRGISDIIGFRRDDRWVEFACRSAAAFTYAFLRTEPIPPLRKDKKVSLVDR